MATKRAVALSEDEIERRRASRRGRPPGSTVPILEHKRRFETAAFLMLHRGLDWGPSDAAVAVAGAFSTRPIRAESACALVMQISTGIDGATLKGRADRIRRRADEMLLAGNDDETAWLVASAAYLCNLVMFIGDAGVTACSLIELRELGWGPTLDRIARRLRDVFHSNLPPIQGPVPRKARLLAEALSAKGYYP